MTSETAIHGDGDPRVWRLGAALAGVYSLSVASNLFSVPVQVYPGWLVPIFLLFGLGLFGLVLASKGASSERDRRNLSLFILTTYLLAALFWAIYTMSSSKLYSSDEVAFAADAVHVLLRGHNPYLTRMGAPPGFVSGPFTPTLLGTYVRSFSYPDLGFLLYVPLVLLGVQNVIVTNLLFMLAGFVLFYLWSPPWARPIVLFLLAMGVLLPNEIPFITDFLYVVPMLGAVRFLRTRLWLSALLYGLACATKQTPWFVAPFLLVAVYFECGEGTAGWRAVLRYAAWALGTFTFVNLPFLIGSPAAWLHGALLPLLSHLAAIGEGLSQLGRLPLHAMPLTALFLIPLGVIFLGLGAAIRFYRRAPAAIFVVPMLALLLASRAFAFYVDFYVPSFALALMLWQPASEEETVAESHTRTLPAARRAMVAAMGLAGLLLLGGGTWLWARDPMLAVARVVAIEPPSHGHRRRLILDVTNESSRALHVMYLASSANEVLVYWPAPRRAEELLPDRTLREVLTEPNRKALGFSPGAPLGSWIQVTLATEAGDQFAGPVFQIR